MSVSIEQASRPLVLLQAVGLLLGVFGQGLVAHTFGTSRDLGLYAVALGVVSFVADWFLRDAVLFTLVPPLRSAHAGLDAERHRAQARVLGIAFLAGAVVASALLAVLAAPLVAVLAPGLDTVERARAATLLRWLLPALPLGALGACLQAELHAQARFVRPTVASVARSAALALAVLLGAPGLGIFALPLGFVLGSLLAVALQARAWPDLRAWLRFDLRRLRIEAPDASYGLIGGMLALGAAGHLNLLTDRFFASLLEPEALAWLAYAERFRFPVMALFAVSVSGPALTFLADAAARGDRERARQTLREAAWLVARMALPALLVMFVARRELVALWLEHGAFSPSDTRRVASVLACLIPAFAVNAFSPLLIAAFFAMGRARSLVRVVAFEVAGNVVLDALWLRPLGLEGLALATSVATALASLVLWKLLADQIGGFGPVRLAPLGRLAAVLGAIAALLAVAFRLTATWDPVARLAVAALISGPVVVADHLRARR